MFSRKLVESLLEQDRDGVTVNILGKLRFVNRRFAEMVGYEINELIGMDILDLHAPEYRGFIREITERRQDEKNVPTSYKTFLLKKNGDRIPVHYNVTLIKFEGKNASFTIIKDLSY